MSQNDILNQLRIETRPIHQKMDNEGIGDLMKKGQFGKEEYRKWLMSTIQINTFLLNEKGFFKNPPFNQYIEEDLGLKYLFEDLGEDLEFQTKYEIDSRFHHHNDYFTAIAYTYLGSTLGSTFIHRYVMKNIEGASIAFLQHMSDQVTKWHAFKKELDQFVPHMPAEEIGKYGRIIFETIHDIQQKFA